MTDASSTHPPQPGAGGAGAADTARDVADTAKQQASQLGGSAADSARTVAGTAKAEAAGVASEAKQQAKALYSETTAQLREQASTQQARAAEGLHGIGGDLDRMAQSSEQQGIASELVSMLATRASGVASWLESREPADVLDDVKRFARRKPGTFIAICAVAGLVGGRLIRSLASEAKDEREASAAMGSPAQHAAAPVPAAGATTVPATSGYEASGTVPGSGLGGTPTYAPPAGGAHAAPATPVVPPPPAPGQGSPFDDGSRP
ncbi:MULTISPECIES: hypothetical protein [unclassified Agrococcus]|uniref:hypothetical protein n=1 Tax=unclassified Agrococcus TaxID=2615065 RepID=UPI00361FEB06